MIMISSALYLKFRQLGGYFLLLFFYENPHRDFLNFVEIFNCSFLGHYLCLK